MIMKDSACYTPRILHDHGWVVFGTVRRKAIVSTLACAAVIAELAMADGSIAAATGLPRGAAATFSPNPARPGRDSALTVTTPADTRNATYNLTVVGTDPTATQYAKVGLTFTGGVDLTVAGLTVADPDNAVDWSVQDNLQVGAVLYGGRTYPLARRPDRRAVDPRRQRLPDGDGEPARLVHHLGARRDGGRDRDP